MKPYLLLMPLLVATAVAGCCRAQLADLPTLVLTDPHAEINAWPLGATYGLVTIDENCIKLEQGRAQRITLIFPPGYKLRQFKQGWAIITSRSNIWGLTGRKRKVGGGELNDAAHVSSFIGPGTQEQCRGPYWLVSPEDPLELRPRNVQPPAPPAVEG